MGIYYPLPPPPPLLWSFHTIWICPSLVYFSYLMDFPTLILIAEGTVALPAEPPVNLQLFGRAKWLNLRAARAMRHMLPW